MSFFFFFQAEDGIRDVAVTGVQTCALPICGREGSARWEWVPARKSQVGVAEPAGRIGDRDRAAVRRVGGLALVKKRLGAVEENRAADAEAIAAVSVGIPGEP